MGDVVGVKVRVDNLGTPYSIRINDSNLVLPSGWSNKTIGPVHSLPQIIPANSSGLIEFNFRVPPSGIGEGAYMIFANITLEENGRTFSTVSDKEITAQPRRDVNLANINWDDITLLFVIYTIPGAAIERAVEAMMGIHNQRVHWIRDRLDRWLESAARIKGLDVILGKMEKSETQDENFLPRYISYYRQRARYESERIARTYFFAVILSFVPAFALTYYGLGLLQILGAPTDVWVVIVDTGTAMIAITFLTKPSHEIIKLLEKLRGYKKGGQVSKENE
jgi:hypothetical protein